MTKSRLPRTATTSLSKQPGKSSGKMLKFTNDGDRIFNALLKGKFDRWEEWT